MKTNVVMTFIILIFVNYCNFPNIMEFHTFPYM